MAIVRTGGQVLTKDHDICGKLAPLHLTFEPWPIRPLPVLVGDHAVLLIYRGELDRWDPYFDLGQFAHYDHTTPVEDLTQISRPRPWPTRGYFCFSGSCRFRFLDDLEVELHGGDFLVVPGTRPHGVELTEEATCKLLVLSRSTKEPTDVDTFP